MRDVEFVNGGYYHIYNRGVDKRVVFKSRSDYQRFLNSLYAFNNVLFSNPGGNSIPSSLRDEDKAKLLEQGKKREPFVNIMSYCLMPNHFHLLLEQLIDGGISRFLHRLAMGYARYFNIRYERTGRLFEGTFKAVRVHRDNQLTHLPRYIHLNALDLTSLQWRQGKIQEWVKAKDWLEKYPWSSHHCYAGKTQILPIVSEERIKEFFSSPKDYWDFLREWSGRFVDNQFVS